MNAFVYLAPVCISMSICAFKGVCVSICVLSTNVAQSAPLTTIHIALPIKEDAFSPSASARIALLCLQVVDRGQNF